MLTGSATADITPTESLDLMGQLHVRKAGYTRDALTANAVVFRQGETTLAIVSVDVGMLPDEFVRQVQKVCEQTHGIPSAHVILHSTHTHVAPCTLDYLPGKMSESYMAELQPAIVRAVAAAIADLEETDLFSGEGFIEQMGWNRRGLHPDGRCDMYYGSWNKDFSGIEGPRDGTVPVIIARRKNGVVKTIITGFASHPNCLEGESFYSADFPGEMRRFVRTNLGNLGHAAGIVYLTGAAGDTAPSIMENNPLAIQPWRGEEGARKSGAYLGGEVLRVIWENAAPFVTSMRDPVLRIASETLRIPIRPWPADFSPEKQVQWAGARDYYLAERALWNSVLATREAEVRLNVLRIGDAAICTNPAELYCRLGHEIKKGSPARVTMVAELTDGYCGYVPTREAFARGGYSVWPSRTAKLPEQTGELIVEASRRLLQQVFR
ncbi:MAG: hypothetical protein IT444_05770 [Phycisphaeraceae bacterium]|nr:hypothetical protein [Phycisphaeraceae bacterium]